MEGAEADVPRKESSNNSTQMAEGHCTRAAGRRVPTHRPSPRAGRGAITWDLKIRDPNGIRLRLAWGSLSSDPHPPASSPPTVSTNLKKRGGEALRCATGGFAR